MEILLIRHAETEANAQRRYIGRTDEPLNEKGLKHARESLFPSVDSVYISPLSRAKQTAQLLFPHIEPSPVDDLIEMDFGDFEGLSADEMVDNLAYRSWVDSFCESECPNGEDRASFETRVFHAFDDIIADAQKMNLKSIAIVAHGGTIMAIMGRDTKETSLVNYEWVTPNCTGYRIKIDPNTWQQDKTFLSFQKINGMDWLENTSSFFQHTECNYFPCHPTDTPEDFNCLFCFCPLYSFGSRCGGDYELSKNNHKSCRACTLPHQRMNYGYILKRTIELPESETKKEE